MPYSPRKKNYLFQISMFFFAFRTLKWTFPLLTTTVPNSSAQLIYTIAGWRSAETYVTGWTVAMKKTQQVNIVLKINDSEMRSIHLKRRIIWFTIYNLYFSFIIIGFSYLITASHCITFTCSFIAYSRFRVCLGNVLILASLSDLYEAPCASILHVQSIHMQCSWFFA